jgi:hypothetical protein
MYLNNYYVVYSGTSTICSISSYKNIMNKFIFKFILKKKDSYIKNKKKLYQDSIIYSKYYLYWKINGCVYNDDIMNLLYDIEYIE